MKELGAVEKTMTAHEARSCIEKINSGLINIRALILDLYERKGWEVLGYESWRKCVTAEFKQQERYLYKQLEAAQIEKNICPMGQIGEIPERQTRPLAQLPPEQQKEAWQKAVETAPEGKVTARHVENTVNKMIEDKEEKVSQKKVVKEITQSKKYKKFLPPSNGLQFARMAIMDLEQITIDDLERDQAFDLVKQWIEKHE